MSVPTGLSLNSKILVEQLQNSLKNITEKFEELQTMYENLMKSINPSGSFQKIKNFVAKDKKSKKSSLSNNISLEAIPLDELDHSLNAVQTLPQAKIEFNRLKKQIEIRDDKIRNLEDTIEIKNEMLKSKTNDFEKVKTDYENMVRLKAKDDVKLRKIEVLEREIEELRKPRGIGTMITNDLKNYDQTYKTLKAQNEECEKKYNEIKSKNDACENKFEDLSNTIDSFTMPIDEEEEDIEGYNEIKHRKRKSSRTRKRKINR